MKRSEKAVLAALFVVLCLLVGGLAALRGGLLERMTPKTYFVYFVSSTEAGMLVEARRTGMPASDGAEGRIAVAVESLLAGVTDGETGCATTLPPQVRLLGCEVREGVAYLDFTRDIERGGGTPLMRARLAQVVFTATQFPRVGKVRFLIEGRAIPYFSSEGLSDVENPLGREDFADYRTGGLS